MVFKISGIYLFQNSSQVIFPESKAQMPTPAKYKKAIVIKPNSITMKSIFYLSFFRLKAIIHANIPYINVIIPKYGAICG